MFAKRKSSTEGLSLFVLYHSTLCIGLAHGIFESTNQDSAGGKNFTVLTSLRVYRKGIEITEAIFLAGDGISFPR